MKGTGMMNRCPFIQNTASSESGREDAMDLAFTAQAVLQGICISALCWAAALRNAA